jgi:hypothetical protein
MKRSRLLCLVVLLAVAVRARSDEGMWIPLLTEQYRIDLIHEAGCRLEPEDIYSINRDCLKDAVVRFGQGCTGAIVSEEGLLLTNHHCGESYIQFHSSVNRDLLSAGYWAGSREEELPCPGLTVSFLRSMEEVTGRVLNGLEPGMDPDERERAMDLNRGRIIKEATEGTYLDAEVRSFYYGNRYYLLVYEVFTDIRLVGAPPKAIGNFGGEADNWIWPRHTGDFSLFRVYADTANRPSDYDMGNRPYRSRGHMVISLDGIREGDFTMVLGYPGSTSSYLYSGAIRNIQEIELPLKISLREKRMKIMERYMNASDSVRIQYTSKYRRVSNYWKKWMGAVTGLRKDHVVETKQEEESDFIGWVEEDGRRILKYGDLMERFSELYGQSEELTVANSLMEEGILAVELFQGASEILGMMWRGEPANLIRKEADLWFRNYCMPLDREVFVSMMEAYHELRSPGHYPPFFGTVSVEFEGNFTRYANSVYADSYFSDRQRCHELIDLYEKDSRKAVEASGGDPAMTLLDEFFQVYGMNISDALFSFRKQEQELYGKYMAGLLEKAGTPAPFPDANRTMRLSYGKVKGYEPRDGVDFLYMTTLKGMMEKSEEGKPEYFLPEKLKILYESRDFAPYSANGAMPVCFLATDHTSGGNSGSPVLDAQGRLIGLNFDRTWEGTMSDYEYNQENCRNISVDIRFILFIIDKYAGARYLVREMGILPEGITTE